MTGNRLKLISDKTPALLAGSRRRVSMSKDNHLGVGNYDNFFKGRVKNLGVYTDATLCMVKHIDHISRSAYVKIRRIRSIRHLLTTKAHPSAHVFFRSQLVGLLHLLAHSYQLPSHVRAAEC